MDEIVTPELVVDKAAPPVPAEDNQLLLHPVLRLPVFFSCCDSKITSHWYNSSKLSADRWGISKIPHGHKPPNHSNPFVASPIVLSHLA